MLTNPRTISATGLVFFVVALVAGCNGAASTPAPTKPEVAPPPSKKSGGDPPVAPTIPTGTTKDTITQPSTDKPQPQKVDFSKLVFPKSESWTKEYNEFLGGSWALYREAPLPNKDTVTEHLYVDFFKENNPQDLDSYAAKLKEENFLARGFVWTEITAKDKLADGFLIKGLSVLAKEKDKKPDLVFVMVRDISGAKFLFHSSGAVSDASRTEAIEMCKGAHFDATK